MTGRRGGRPCVLSRLWVENLSCGRVRVVFGSIPVQVTDAKRMLEAIIAWNLPAGQTRRQESRVGQLSTLQICYRSGEQLPFPTRPFVLRQQPLQ